MYARPFSSASQSSSALHPPETFQPPTSSSTSTIHSTPKQESPETTELMLIDNRSNSRSHSPDPVPRSTNSSRQYLFAALELGNYFIRQPCSIASANNLDEIQLKRCFEILHACHVATNPDATLVSTRDIIEDFLKAVFKEWTGQDERTMVKPKMDFVVSEFTRVGNICGQPSHHQTASASACTQSLNCKSPIYGIATYKSHPAQLSIAFLTEEPPSRPGEPLQGLFCPMERTDVRFLEESDWMAVLRQSMKKSCTKKVYRHNKRLAIWYSRVLIRGWARGSIWMGKDVEVLAFVPKDAVDAAFAMMGHF